MCGPGESQGRVSVLQHRAHRAGMAQIITDLSAQHRGDGAEQLLGKVIRRQLQEQDTRLLSQHNYLLFGQDSNFQSLTGRSRKLQQLPQLGQPGGGCRSLGKLCRNSSAGRASNSAKGRAAAGTEKGRWGGQGTPPRKARMWGKGNLHRSTGSQRGLGWQGP